MSRTIYRYSRELDRLVPVLPYAEARDFMIGLMAEPPAESPFEAFNRETLDALRGKFRTSSEVAAELGLHSGGPLPSEGEFNRAMRRKVPRRNG